MGWDGGRERRKGEREERGYTPKLQFLAPPLQTGNNSATNFICHVNQVKT